VAIETAEEVAEAVTQAGQRPHARGGWRSANLRPLRGSGIPGSSASLRKTSWSAKRPKQRSGQHPRNRWRSPSSLRPRTAAATSLNTNLQRICRAFRKSCPKAWSLLTISVLCLVPGPKMVTRLMSRFLLMSHSFPAAWLPNNTTASNKTVFGVFMIGPYGNFPLWLTSVTILRAIGCDFVGQFGTPDSRKQALGWKV